MCDHNYTVGVFHCSDQLKFFDTLEDERFWNHSRVPKSRPRKYNFAIFHSFLGSKLVFYKTYDQETSLLSCLGLLDCNGYGVHGGCNQSRNIFGHPKENGKSSFRCSPANRPILILGKSIDASSGISTGALWCHLGSDGHDSMATDPASNCACISHFTK
mmetsp:Transcript_17077/g.38424  ORF Transcript_17077/g.38424 Transcript_17077/m.38424 type:complete len:159 (+) Transcript_17077:1267-1743(+)